MWKWLRWVLCSIGALAVLFLLLMFFGNYGHFTDTDYNNPPVFVTADFIDLSKIDTISKFRSGVGHDYSGNGETCRSMRHYFGNSSKAAEFKNGDEKLAAIKGQPDPAHATDVFAPADGWILWISGEDTPVGNQVEIAADKGQGYHIRIDHMYPDKNVHSFMHVKAGQHIGLIHENQTIDMTVFYVYRGSPRLVSYFQVMTDEVFARYQARGVASRNDFIIQKAVVDANPWKCSGGHKDTPSFAENYSVTPAEDKFNNVHLSGWVDNSVSVKVDQTKK